MKSNPSQNEPYFQKEHGDICEKESLPEIRVTQIDCGPSNSKLNNLGKDLGSSRRGSKKSLSMVDTSPNSNSFKMIPDINFQSMSLNPHLLNNNSLEKSHKLRNKKSLRLLIIPKKHSRKISLSPGRSLGKVFEEEHRPFRQKLNFNHKSYRKKSEGLFDQEKEEMLSARSFKTKKIGKNNLNQSWQRAIKKRILSKNSKSVMKNFFKTNYAIKEEKSERSEKSLLNGSMYSKKMSMGFPEESVEAPMSSLNFNLILKNNQESNPTSNTFFGNSVVTNKLQKNFKFFPNNLGNTPNGSILSHKKDNYHFPKSQNLQQGNEFLKATSQMIPQKFTFQSCLSFNSKGDVKLKNSILEQSCSTDKQYNLMVNFLNNSEVPVKGLLFSFFVKNCWNNYPFQINTNKVIY